MSFAFAGKFPQKRPRRMRRDDFSRRMMRETRLAPDDFIYPVFVLDGTKREEPVPSMPGVSRRSVDGLFRDAEAASRSAFPRSRCFRSCRESSSPTMPPLHGIPRASCRAPCAR